MTNKEKELFLIDLLARLPYGVKVTWDGKHPLTVTPHVYCAITSEDNINKLPKIFLRSMLSMTEEEFQELHSICPHSVFNKTNVLGWIIGINGSDYGRISRIDEISKLIDWLNKKMFDYRKDDEGKTMIEKGLALETPEKMYNLKRNNYGIP